MKSFSEYLDEDLDEAVKRKVVIRGGKRKIKFVSDRPGYYVKDKREIKIGASDAIKMSLRNKKSARKRRGKIAISNTRRARSNVKRTGL
jgi:hypothetical protein